MVERKTIRGNERVSEELLGAKVYFEDGLVSGFETPEGERTSVNYLRKNNGRIQYRDHTPLVDEVIFADGSKLKRDPKNGDYLSAQGNALYASPVVHRPSMGDNQAFIRYCDAIGNPRTTFASLGEITGQCLPIDRGLLLDLWRKNLPRITDDGSGKVDLADLVKAVQNPSFTGMDAVFIATLKKHYDLIGNVDKKGCITETDMAILDQCFSSFRPGYTGRRWGRADDLDTILNAWVHFQNKSKFVTTELYSHGPAASIRPEYVLQGDAGNCFWQSAVMSIAKTNPNWIENMIKKDSRGNFQVLFPQKRWCNGYVTVKPLTATEQLLYSGAAGGGQWSGVLEKALGQYKDFYALQDNKKPRVETETAQDYCDGGNQTEMLNLLTDGQCVEAAPVDSDLEKLHQILQNAVHNHMPMGAGIAKPMVKGLHGNHNYAVLDYDADARLVTMYDPNHYFEAKDKKGKDRDGVKNGIFTISLAEFKKSCDEFNYLNRPFEEHPFIMPQFFREGVFEDSNILRANGEVTMATQEEAMALCKKLGVHLPTAREFAQFINLSGIMEVREVEKLHDGVVPEGYYLVECQNEGGKIDRFYFNNSKSPKLTGEVAKLSFWTSSKVLGNPKYAHVFYGYLGGGGGEKEDHEIGKSHAVLFLPPSQADK